jgi:hypothetical protein
MRGPVMAVTSVRGGWAGSRPGRRTARGGIGCGRLGLFEEPEIRLSPRCGRRGARAFTAKTQAGIMPAERGVRRSRGSRLDAQGSVTRKVASGMAGFARLSSRPALAPGTQGIAAGDSGGPGCARAAGIGRDVGSASAPQSGPCPRSRLRNMGGSALCAWAAWGGIGSEALTPMREPPLRLVRDAAGERAEPTGPGSERGSCQGSAEPVAAEVC